MCPKGGKEKLNDEMKKSNDRSGEGGNLPKQTGLYHSSVSDYRKKIWKKERTGKLKIEKKKRCGTEILRNGVE